MFFFVGKYITKLTELEVHRNNVFKKTNNDLTFRIIEDISLVFRDQIVSMLRDAAQVSGTTKH